MKQLTLEVTRRNSVGSSASKRDRAQGLIPSVIYSHGETTVSALLSYKEFEKVARMSKSSQIFLFKSADSALEGKTALVKEIQKDYVAGRVLHVDFQALKENEAITVKIPLNIVGESEGVKLEGGILTISAHEVTVSCLPRLIPEFIEINVAPLKLGQSIHARDLTLADGVELKDDPDETIVSVVSPKAAEEEVKPAAVDAAAATAEGGVAPAPGAAAATPAEGAEKAEKGDKGEKGDKKDKK